MGTMGTCVTGVCHSAVTCSKLTIETLEQGVKYVQSYVLIVNFEQISHLVLVFLLLTLSS